MKDTFEIYRIYITFLKILNQNIAINILESPFVVLNLTWNFSLLEFSAGNNGEEFRKFVFGSISVYPNFQARPTLHIEALKFWTLQFWMLRNALQF